MSQIHFWDYKLGYVGKVLVFQGSMRHHAVVLDIGEGESLCTDCRGQGMVRIRFGGPGSECENDWHTCDKCDGKGKIQ